MRREWLFGRRPRFLCLWSGLAIAIVLGLPSSHVVRAQNPPRDVTAVVPGSAVLSGIVVTDDATAAPVRRVRVIATSGTLRAPESTMTDDAGRFVFRGLSAGNYALRATKPGFVTVFHGAPRAGRGPGVPVALSEGQRVEGLTVRLPRGAVITGTVRQENGGVAAGIQVQATQIDMRNGQRRLALTASAVSAGTTDDHGVYRLFGLTPGDYVVQIQPAIGQTLETVPTSAAEIRWAEQAMAAARSASLGPATALPPAPPPGRPISYAAVYFPGTAVASEAAVVTVAAGAERAGIDVTTRLVPLSQISGTIVDPSGQSPQSVRLALVAAGGAAESNPSDIVASLAGEGMFQVSADGRFTVRGVAPGRYTLTARGAPHIDNGTAPAAGAAARVAEPMLASPMLGGTAGGPSTLWATETVIVEGQDVPNLQLQLQSGMTIAGTVVYDAPASAQVPAAARGRLLLMPMPEAGSSTIQMLTSVMTAASVAAVAADGSFSFTGVTPGKYRVTDAGAGLFGVGGGGAVRAGAWILRSAIVSGRDVADLPLEIAARQDISGLVVTMTDRPTQLSGAILDQIGRPVSSFPIMVFAASPAYWTPGSRRIQQTRPSSDGKFRIAGLPPGEYFLAAVTEIDPNDLYDPAFLEQASAGAIRITLGDGESRTQDVKLAGG